MRLPAVQGSAVKLRSADARERPLLVLIDPSTSNAEMAEFQEDLPANPPVLPDGVDTTWAATRGIEMDPNGGYGVNRLWCCQAGAGRETREAMPSTREPRQVGNPSEIGR